jgi:carbonic anhydrase
MSPPTETDTNAQAQASAPAGSASVPSPRSEAGAEETATASGIAAYLPKRREALFLLGGGLLGATIGAGAAVVSRSPSAPIRDDAAVLSGRDARDRLEAGNNRFAAGAAQRPDQSVERRDAVAATQKPFCAVLSCADSRVPPEVIFDQGIGDLYVVRSAGQVLDHAVLGSLQYSVDRLAVPLLVVLGHTQCGSMKAAIDALDGKVKNSGTDIDTLTTALEPAVREAEEIGADKDSLLSVATDINVERIVNSLKKAALIGNASLMRKVKIVGATYSVKTGQVTWA